MLFAIVAFIVILAVLDARHVAQVLDDVRRHHRPLAELAYELEINVHELGVGVLGYVARPDSGQLAVLRRDLTQLRNATRRFDSISSAAGHDPQLTARRQLRELVARYATLADSVVGSVSSSAPPPTRREPAGDFNALRLRLDSLLDVVVQPRAVEAWHGAADLARIGSRRTAWVTAALSLLAMGVALTAIITSTRAYRAMRAALDTAERVGQQKAELASITAHELRSPLTAILGSLQLTVSGKVGALSDSSRSFLEIGIRSSKRMLELINDLLDLDQIEAGVMPFAEDDVDCRELVRASVESLFGLVSECGVTIAEDVRVTRPIRADGKRLQQVLINLISNAVKHAPRGSTIEILVADKHEVTRFSIRDHGPGIKPSDRDRIFQRFVRTGSAAQHPSTGLGLAIAREIVHRHNGRIGVDSVWGEGSTFWFEIPMQHPMAESELAQLGRL